MRAVRLMVVSEVGVCEGSPGVLVVVVSSEVSSPLRA